jgi:diphthamide synthase subunit DPH2
MSTLTNLEISIAVNNALKARGWSVRKCSESFNINYLDKIRTSNISAMDKDFIQRVKQNKFKVVNKRVLLLCDFLNINLKRENTSFEYILSDEFHAIEVAIRKNPSIEKQIRELLANIAEVIVLSVGDELHGNV